MADNIVNKTLIRALPTKLELQLIVNISRKTLRISGTLINFTNRRVFIEKRDKSVTSVSYRQISNISARDI